VRDVQNLKLRKRRRKGTSAVIKISRRSRFEKQATARQDCEYYVSDHGSLEAKTERKTDLGKRLEREGAWVLTVSKQVNRGRSTLTYNSWGASIPLQRTKKGGGKH